MTARQAEHAAAGINHLALVDKRPAAGCRRPSWKGSLQRSALHGDVEATNSY